MIFKILPASTTFHGVDYSEKKVRQGSASLLHFDHFGVLQDGRATILEKELKDYLRRWSARNSRIKNPQFHAILSCKGKEMNHEILKEKALELMDKLGYSKIPILIYAHKDTDNNHVHIVTSRVGVDGKKIAHEFERKRANSILNQLMGLEPSVEYKAYLEKAMSYKFTSVAQFIMLMESMGYEKHESDNKLLFFKHGNQQGVVERLDLERLINSHKLADRKQFGERIKTLLYENGGGFSAALYQQDSIHYSAKRQIFRSELTEHMKAKYGIEFVFFCGNNASKPYGYAILDHSNLMVFKGSEVMRLEKLINLPIAHVSTGAEKGSLENTSLAENQTVDNGEKEARVLKQTDSVSKQGDIGFTSDNLVEGIAAGLNALVDVKNSQDTGTKSPPVRRKRKNSFF